MSKQLTIGLVGCGSWGKNILRDLTSLSASVIVYERPDFDPYEALSLGAQACYTDLNYLADMDGIIIASPASTHADVLEQVLAYQIPIFVEKPLTTSLQEVLSLQHQVHKKVYLMHIWRYHRGIELLGEIARSQELGKVLGLKTMRCNWTSPRTDTDSIWNLLPHDLTIAREILGQIPEPRFAEAEIHEGIARGMHVFLGKNPYCMIEVSNRYWDKRREVRLHCEGGIAILSDEKTAHLEIVWGDHHCITDKARVEKRFFENYPPLLKELEVFLNYLQGGPAPKSDFAEGFEVIQTIDILRKLAQIN